MDAFLLRALARIFSLSGVLLIFAASQIFWFRRMGELFERWIPRRSHRWWLGGGLFAGYATLFVTNIYFRRTFGETPYLSLRHIFITASFTVWAIGSGLGFLLVVALKVPIFLAEVFRRIAARLGSRSAADWVSPQGVLSPDRRAFLHRSVYAAGTLPFFGVLYGFLYERLHFETTGVKIPLSSLPGEFHGFRIAQLSDIHIGGFMTERQICQVVEQVNALKPDLVALTGDYVTWDASTQKEVVAALSGLQAPYGVVGCLGNHETWSGVEDSITKLFADDGVRILRKQNRLLQVGGERLNVIGVDYQRERSGHLKGVEKLIASDTTNILLSHNPNSFRRAAELGIA